jgi:hypothetical protein
MKISNWKNACKTVLNERMRRPKLPSNEVVAPEEEEKEEGE